MKDYRLSEIKKICEEHSTDYDRLCGKCPLRNDICKEIENAPATWEIDEKEYKETVVALTREECDSKVILDEDHFLRVLDNEREKAHKETAKEIFKSFENAFSLYYPHGLLTYDDFQNHFMYLAEKYGVEVKDD